MGEKKAKADIYLKPILKYEKTDDVCYLVKKKSYFLK